VSTLDTASPLLVNEAGVNSPFINDASALPGQTYDYILVGVNNVSGCCGPTAASFRGTCEGAGRKR